MAACEFTPPRAFDTGDYSPLIGREDDFPAQGSDNAELYPEEASHTPEEPEEEVPVYNPSPSLPQTNHLERLIVLPPPQQNIYHSSAPVPQERRERSWTMAVTPARGPGVSLLGPRVKK